MPVPLLVLLAGGVLAYWLLSDVILLAFAAILVAVMLDWAVEAARRVIPLPRVVVLLIVLFALAGVVAATSMLVGMRIAADFTYLYHQVPTGLADLAKSLGLDHLDGTAGERVVDLLGQSGLIGQLAGYTSAMFGAVTGLFLVIVAGIYLAAERDMYLRGVRHMLPRGNGEWLAESLENAGRVLRLWLLGQLILMVTVGTVTTIGLSILGVPSPLGLGLLAGLLEFIPVAGPIIAAIPALLVSLSESRHLVFWVLGLYFVINQLEGNILIPVIQMRTVSLPPVLGLFSILVFGLLFGPLGVALGTPAAVVVYLLVKQHYVRDFLGREVQIPGDLNARRRSEN